MSETGVATLVGSQESAAPLIVETDFNEGEIKVREGQPTFDQAKDAFLAGRNVLVKIFADGLLDVMPISFYRIGDETENMYVWYDSSYLLVQWE